MLTQQQRVMAEVKQGIYRLDKTAHARKDGRDVGVPSHWRIQLTGDVEHKDALEAVHVIVKDLSARGGRRILEVGTRFIVLTGRVS